MKRTFKLIALVLAFVLVFTVTGCDNNSSSKFKNPKDVTISRNKAKVTFTYDDDGKYDVNKVDKRETIISNSDRGFRIDFMFGNESIDEQEKTKGYFKKDDTYLVLENIEFGGYKGYVSIHKEYATADVYLYLDEKRDVVVDIRVSTTKTSEVEKALKTTEVEDVLYNKEEVQDILKTIKYESK